MLAACPRRVGVNFYITGAASACIYVGAIEALQETAATVRSLQLQLGDGARLVLEASLRSTPPDYLECGGLTPCRASRTHTPALLRSPALTRTIQRLNQGHRGLLHVLCECTRGTANRC